MPCIILIVAVIIVTYIGNMILTTPGLTFEQMLIAAAFGALIFAIAIGVTVSCSYGKARGQFG